MTNCKNLSSCGFVTACKEMKKESAVNGFINMYCKGARQDQCVRFRLCNQFGKQVVPSNMMPTGYPLPGTSKDGWCQEASNFSRFLKK